MFAPPISIIVESDVYAHELIGTVAKKYVLNLLTDAGALKRPVPINRNCFLLKVTLV